MSIIFDLRNEPNDWAIEINKDILASFPNFFDGNPIVGSPEWWDKSEFDSAKGKIKHVGPFIDDGELIDVVSIEPVDENFNGSDEYKGIGQPEYMIYRDDFWLNNVVTVDKLVEIESITICPSGELDELSLYIETKVKVW